MSQEELARRIETVLQTRTVNDEWDKGWHDAIDAVCKWLRSPDE